MTVYIVILAVLVLGGAIATAGDRIGTKVGKARLSLFKMRPRQTATVVTILSGSLVAATTLGILLATDKQLRTGLFELKDIQRDLATSRQQLDRAKQQKQQIERELTQAQTDQEKAKQRLTSLNQSLARVSEKLKASQDEQAETEDRLDATQLQLNNTQGSLSRVSQERAQVEAQLNQTQAQKQALQSEITELQTDRQQLIEQREAVTRQIAERDRAIRQNQEQLEMQQQQIATQQQQIGEKQQQIDAKQQQLADQEELLRSQEQTLAQREELLDRLKEEQASLEDQVNRLEYGFRQLRERRVAIGRGQVLASGVIRIIQPYATERVVEELLREANRVAVQLTRPGAEATEPAIVLDREEFEGLLEQIRDGNEYVVRVLSAGNYILGEAVVQVDVEVVRNRLVFDLGEVVSAAEIDPQAMSQEAIAERIALLLEAARFRALQQGMLGERIQVADGQRETVLEFIRQIQQQPQPVDVQAIVTDLTYTAGPLKLKLVAFRGGEMVLETSDREP
jgi:uncharacterized protein (DUF3084 family)